MALGMNISVPAPAPLPRPWATAVTTYMPLVGPEYEGTRWLNGVKFTPLGCEKIVGDTFDPCVDRETDFLEGLGTEVSFEPFQAEVAVEWATISTDGPELELYLRLHMTLGYTSILGAQVERSAFTPGNPSLSSEAQVIASSDQSLLGALVNIEDALADVLDGGQGMIHMTPGLFVAFSAGGGVRYDADGRPFTASGHLIVADAGYLGVSPVTDAPVVGETWIYGSGPVFHKASDQIRWFTDAQSVNLSRNLRNVTVQQYGLAIFEPCSVVAAKLDTSDNEIILGS
jgi:hypothetical protein